MSETVAIASEEPVEPAPVRPWLFVPLLYFMEGIPYVIVTGLSVAMYNVLEIPKEQFALWTSLIAFPWTLKMLWGPLVDLNATKRKWITATQGLLFALMVAAAFALGRDDFFVTTLVLFGTMAFLSATHDIAADGFYLLSLGKRAQAFFVGIRSTFYRLATIFVSGFLVYLAGRWMTISESPYEVVVRGGEVHSYELTSFGRLLQSVDTAAGPFITDDYGRAWGLAIFFGAIVFGIGWLLNRFVLPRPQNDQPQARRQEGESIPLVEAFRSFFAQKRILAILGFILFYRFGESMIGKLSVPFLQDSFAKGGLGVPTSEVGVISGTVGVVALTLGGILGGFTIAKWGIKRCLWPMVLALNIPNLFYVWAAFAKPGMGAVTGLIAVDQFGYGFGFSAYMVFLMFVSQGSRFKTSNYAIATGLMALGAMLAGIASGYAYKWAEGAFGASQSYAWFFVLVCACTIPGMITLFFIPKEGEDIREAPVEID